MIGAAALFGLALSLQLPDQLPAHAPNDSVAIAVRADVQPVIDGKDDDLVWRTAPEITGFRQWQPTEGEKARFRTEAKVAFDAANLYVFVRAFDPHPDSIIRLLERRDTFTPSDMIWLFVDSYHDRRTGYEFGVNAAGVKIDQAIYDDGNEDVAWDGVWDVATRIDSLGWSAEFRIPLSQLRYGKGRSLTFGIMIDRDIYRYAERVSWPVLRQSKSGIVSQFGALEGLNDLEAPRRLEAVPYVVTRNASQITNNSYGQRSNVTAGGDLKYHVASNLTLDVTVNPDFGQVESDPAVLNLSAYESFFDERRPFFVAGRGLFRFDVNCNQVSCRNEGLYYSRRIGRTPGLAGAYDDTVPQQPTTILGAAKLVGRFRRGLTLGVLDAATQRAASSGDITLEPMTNFGVVRVQQDLLGGSSTIGAMLTAVNRRLDAWSSPYLASSAYAGGLDFRHRLLQNNYEISGSLDESRVQGSRAAMLALETDAVHNYQRPDARFPLDSSRTVLAGNAEEFKFAKIGGQYFQFQTAYDRESEGFEINDLGFLLQADQQQWNTWFGFFDRHERRYYNRFQWNNYWAQYWTTAALPVERQYVTSIRITFRNNWNLSTTGTLGQLGTTFGDRTARGGPAIRQDPYSSVRLSIGGNDRRALVPQISAHYFRGDSWRNSYLSLSPELDYKVLGRFSSALSFNWTHGVFDNQWYGNFIDALGTHYTFAHLDQTTTSATVRLNYTFMPDVSLQGYVQPYLSKGTYSNVRQLSATPRAADYEDRYSPFDDIAVTSNPGGFNFKAFQSNVVFRWEYNPGSTLFLVWNEGRRGLDSSEGTGDFNSNLRDLFRLHPVNTFLVKVSYWLNR
jgi:hypothetical protein